MACVCVAMLKAASVVTDCVAGEGQTACILSPSLVGHLDIPLREEYQPLLE